MGKRKQRCDNCDYPIRHGYPRLGKLFCTLACMSEYGKRVVTARANKK